MGLQVLEFDGATHIDYMFDYASLTIELGHPFLVLGMIEGIGIGYVDDGDLSSGDHLEVPIEVEGWDFLDADVDDVDWRIGVRS